MRNKVVRSEVSRFGSGQLSFNCANFVFALETEAVA